jgi:hypothetical protein
MLCFFFKIQAITFCFLQNNRWGFVAVEEIDFTWFPKNYLAVVILNTREIVPLTDENLDYFQSPRYRCTHIPSS